MMEIQELKKSHRQNAKLLAGRYAGIALLLGHVVGVHSTTTWSKGLRVPPAIKVEGDMCGGLNGIYMYSDLWEPHSNLFDGKATSAPMYMREALLCSDGDAYHGLKCGKDNEAGTTKDMALSPKSYLYYDTFCDSDIDIKGVTSEKFRPHLHNRWLFDQGQKPSNERDYDLDSQWAHGFGGPNGKGDSKCSINGFPLAEVCEPSWCPDDTSAPIAKGPLLGTQVWTIVGEVQFLKHVQDAHGCPGAEDEDGVFIPTSSNQTITLSCHNPYAEGSENYNSDPCGNHPTQVTMQTTATTVTTVTTVTTLVKCDPGEYLVGDKCAECGVDQFQDAADHRHTACTDLTVCDKGTQYEIQAPTKDTDRKCANLAVCDKGTEYESEAPTKDTDRKCANLAVCDKGTEYESEAPTKETDRECTPLTVCDKGTQYESEAPTKETDRECTPLTVCDKGTQYESEAPTKDTDRECSALTVCDKGTEYETQAPTKDTDRICEATTATPIATTTTTAITTTAYDPGNVDCEEKQDACTSACESANKRNYVVATPQNKNGKACGGATDCVPGEGACPTTSTTAATTSTNTSTTAAASTTTQAANKVAGDGGGAEGGAAAANADADVDAAAEAPTSTTTTTSATTLTVAGDAAESEAEKTSTAAVVGAVVAFVVIAAVVAIALCKRGGGDDADKPAMVITANPAFARHANVPLTANVMYASAENPRLANNGVYEGVGLVADGRLAANVTYEGTGGAGAGGNRYSGPRPANGGGDMVYYDAEPVPGMHDQPEYAEPDTPAKPLGGVTYAMMQSEQARGGAPMYADVAEVQQRNNHYDLGPQKPRNNHYDLGPQTARGSLTPAGLPARDEGTWQEQEDTIKRDNSFV